MSSPPVRLLVVGDIHGHWSPEDAAYLEDGDQDLTLFVGDLGDEQGQVLIAVLEVGGHAPSFGSRSEAPRP